MSLSALIIGIVFIIIGGAITIHEIIEAIAERMDKMNRFGI